MFRNLLKVKITRVSIANLLALVGILVMTVWLAVTLMSLRFPNQGCLNSCSDECAAQFVEHEDISKCIMVCEPTCQ